MRKRGVGRERERERERESETERERETQREFNDSGQGKTERDSTKVQRLCLQDPNCAVLSNFTTIIILLYSPERKNKAPDQHTRGALT